MYLVADALRKAFASDEAREGLRTMVTAVAELAMVVAKNLSTIVEYGLAWAAFKATMLGAKAIVAASNQKTLSATLSQSSSVLFSHTTTRTIVFTTISNEKNRLERKLEIRRIA
jgi:predicted transcriptional regulator